MRIWPAVTFKNQTRSRELHKRTKKKVWLRSETDGGRRSMAAVLRHRHKLLRSVLEPCCLFAASSNGNMESARPSTRLPAFSFSDCL